jgi:hypothetical protein
MTHHLHPHHVVRHRELAEAIVLSLAAAAVLIAVLCVLAWQVR